MKRKGLVLQFQLVLLLVMITLLIGGGLWFNSITLDREKTARMHEMAAIQLALTKYAKHHTGATPRKEDAQDEWILGTFQRGDSEVNRFLYDKPGLYPKDLFELCELGYLPANFFGDMKAYQKTGRDTDNSVTTYYGSPAKGQYTYTVYKSDKLGDDSFFKQYVKYELSFTGKNGRIVIPHKIFVSE